MVYKVSFISMVHKGNMSVIIWLSVFVMITRNGLVQSADIMTETPAKICGPNQFWNSCGSACIPEPSCENSIKPTGLLCPAVCIPKCSCIKGYVWYEGKCIRSSACPNYHPGLGESSDIITESPPKICGRNQYWNLCGSTCIPEPTCENSTKATGLLCPAVCIPRCSCIKGYIWYKGKCIRSSSCPNYQPDLNPCGIGGFIDNCASDCDSSPTCLFENLVPLRPFKICTDKCFEKCKCYPGYVLFEGRCIGWLECIRDIRPTRHEISKTTATTAETK